MSRLNQISFFDKDSVLVVAQNNSLPQMNGSKLSGLVKTINNNQGNIEIVPGSGKVKVDSTTKPGIISLDIQVPNSQTLFIQLNGKNIIAPNYSVTYRNYRATITHNLNARVVGFVYDENDKQAFYGVDYLDDDNVYIQFDKENFPSETNIWKVSLGIGGGVPVLIDNEYPNENSTNSKVPSSLMVYRYVTQQIEQFQESLQIVDQNFQVILNKTNQLQTKDLQLDEKIQLLNTKLNQVYTLIQNMGTILDKINGVTKTQ